MGDILSGLKRDLHRNTVSEILEEASGRTDQSIKDIFLDDVEFSLVGAENDPAVAKMVDAISIDDTDDEKEITNDVLQEAINELDLFDSVEESEPVTEGSFLDLWKDLRTADKTFRQSLSLSEKLAYIFLRGDYEKNVEFELKRRVDPDTGKSFSTTVYVVGAFRKTLRRATTKKDIDDLIKSIKKTYTSLNAEKSKIASKASGAERHVRQKDFERDINYVIAHLKRLETKAEKKLSAVKESFTIEDFDDIVVSLEGISLEGDDLFDSVEESEPVTEGSLLDLWKDLRAADKDFKTSLRLSEKILTIIFGEYSGLAGISKARKKDPVTGKSFNDNVYVVGAFKKSLRRATTKNEVSECISSIKKAYSTLDREKSKIASKATGGKENLSHKQLVRSIDYVVAHLKRLETKAEKKLTGVKESFTIEDFDDVIVSLEGIVLEDVGVEAIDDDQPDEDTETDDDEYILEEGLDLPIVDIDFL